MKQPVDRSAWQEARRKGIGGSDVAGILGLSEWDSPYSVWADKLGMLPEREENEAMRQGRDLEEYVARRFAEKTEKKVRRVTKMLRHPDHPFMLANIDRDVVGEDAGLECKTTSSMNLKKFKNGEYPATYYCQCVHYMAVTGAKKWYLAVLVLGRDFYVFEITRDESEIEALIQAEHEFWEYVETRSEPPIDGTDATRRAVEAVHTPGEDEPAAILYGSEHLLAEREAWQTQKKAAERGLEQINSQLISKMGSASRGIMHGYEITRQTIVKSPYTVTPKPYTQLKIKEVG